MKINTFKKVIENFYPKKMKLFLMLFFSVIAGFMEFLGLVLIFQFILFLTNPTSNFCIKIIDFCKNFALEDFSKISLIIGILVALIYIFKNIFMMILTKYNNNILSDISKNMTLKTVSNLLFGDYLTINSIENSKKISYLNNIEIIVWQYIRKFFNLTTNLIVAIILISFLFIKFTSIAIISSLLIIILASIEYKYLKNKSINQQKNYTNSVNNVNDIKLKTVELTKEIRLNSKENIFIENFKNVYNSLLKLNKERYFNSVLHIYFTEISIMLIFILVLVMLFITTNFNNALIISSISTICVVILRLTPLINRCQSALYIINSNEKVVEEFLDFYNQFSYKLTYTKEKLPFEKAIEFKNVDFIYKNKNGIKNINLKINKGDFIALVGKSGSYKTTISNVLAGLYPINKGEILIDDILLDKNNTKAWQNNISYVFQDCNLIFDKLDKTDFDIKILKKLDLNLDNIKNINELSQGQKQRLALLCAINNDKELLILDEITSNLDSVSEEKINDFLVCLNTKKSKTIVAITHRINILKHCNKIIFTNSNGIVDINNFEYLYNNYEDFRQIIENSKPNF